MGELPSGTVTLLFSDIEGSTVLLGRLGDAYSEALDGQRRVLRTAWAEHGGTELGTEGDSFFVVFPTAGAAVEAAVQAQRELADYPWPGGERLRVRMGIHSGTPKVHDGGYVGMDVHRAARITAAAHGGQVVVSSVTAELIAGCLPERVGLRDLGCHRLKDIARPERLFQLSIQGLAADFPPLKSLGASSSLPRPATPLVGRDGELAEVTAVLSSPGVRLVTLTGPGGSGKTRLAIALADRLTERYPDGVYFVPLAAVTSPDVMWTSIAEVLDAPPEARMPPGLFTHIAHRSVMMVLDNLEQLPGADGVVADLMDAAPQLRVLATSRRPLHLPGEHEHPVPPLQLPEGRDEVEAAGAVQMFVQQARLVRPGFAVTAENAADVVAVCRRLDGLPLAIELAATRSKLLSPSALLARLDTALDIPASGSRGPSRQKTLRDTIAWSYQLLEPAQQALFRRLGVFAGGADLDAITAVTADIVHAGWDPLDLVVELVDASLVTIGQDALGEPRVGLLETIRTFALSQLTAAGERDKVSELHARYYLSRATWLKAQLDAGGRDRILLARRHFEADVDNYRAALTWALAPGLNEAPTACQAELALQLCAALSLSWSFWGYHTEALEWLPRAIELGPKEDSYELAWCLGALSAFMAAMGREESALDLASHSVAVCRRVGDKAELALALQCQGLAERRLGKFSSARLHFEEALTAAREANDRAIVAGVLVEAAHLEYQTGNPERRVDLERQALSIYEDRGDDYWAVAVRGDIACSLRLLGRLEEAEQLMLQVVSQLLQVGPVEPWLAEDYGALLADLGSYEAAARLLGTADAARERSGVPRDRDQEAEYRGAFGAAREALFAETWNREYQKGHTMSLDDAVKEALSTRLELA
jgi:predicted ATPase/class 3 adenylate cyclase